MGLPPLKSQTLRKAKLTDPLLYHILPLILLSMVSSTYPSQIVSMDVLPANQKRLMVHTLALWTRLTVHLSFKVWGTLDKDGGLGEKSTLHKPASPVKVSTVTQIAEAPSPTPTIPAAQVPGSKDPTPILTILPEPPKGNEVPSSNSPGALKNTPDLPGVQPVAGSSAVAGEQAAPVQETSVLNQGGLNPLQSVPVLIFEWSTYQANQASHFIIASQTLTPGGKITISGTPVAIDEDASAAVIGTTTQSLSKAGVTQKPLLVFAGTTYTADDSTHFVIDGNTLTKGGTINVDNTQLSFDKWGAGVVIGTSTQ